MQKRKGMTPVKKPELELDTGIHLDQSLNDTDIFVVEIKGKDVVGTKESIEKLSGFGKVKIRFVNKNGREAIHYT